MEGTQGRKEVKEAVVIAALSAVATGLVNLGLEEFKKWNAKREEARKQALNGKAAE